MAPMQAALIQEKVILIFYIIAYDGVADIPAETTKAHKSIRRVGQRPEDIGAGNISRFETRKNSLYRKRSIQKRVLFMTQEVGEQHENEMRRKICV